MNTTNDQLTLAFSGEHYGEGFFSRLHREGQLIDRPLWQAMAAVEHQTGEILGRRLNRSGNPRAETEAYQRGVNDAVHLIGLERSAYLERLLNWVTPYEVQYRQWADDATNTSQEDAMVYRMLADHESALRDSLLCVASGESGLPVLRDFVSKYGRWTDF